jgi:hypothetical protein
MHDAEFAFCFASANAGSNSAANIAMIAMTTSNSMSVKPHRLVPPVLDSNEPDFFGVVSIHFTTRLFAQLKLFIPF